MNVESVIIPQNIEDKLETKHNVTRREVEQVFNSQPRFRFAEKGHVRGEHLFERHL